MNETLGPAQSQGNIGRSILAVFVGFVVVVIITIGTDAILHAVHFYPPLGEYDPGSVLIWATIYRTICPPHRLARRAALHLENWRALTS